MFWFWTALAVFGAPGLFFVALGFWIMVFQRTPYDGGDHQKDMAALKHVVEFPARWHQ